MLKRWRENWNRSLEEFRLLVSHADAIGPLSLLGVTSGVLAGAVIIAFRLLVESLQGLFLHGAPLDYEHLDPLWRFLVPLLGGLALAVMFVFLRESSRRVGVTHILERLDYYQGRLPWRNALVQFFGGAIALVSGQSVGREGPSIHLGAASSNLPAQYLGLPNNALRVVAACGTAAGIAATFNTPLAGVAFAMEVLMIESTVAAFAPVILAAVSATTLTRLVFGDHVAFAVPALEIPVLADLPFILVLGLLIGMLSSLFVRSVTTVAQHNRRLPPWSRPLLAALVVALLGLAVPEVLGIGYDTVNHSLAAELGLGLMAGMVVAKFIATAVAIGLGVPGGIIGPSLVIGAISGGLLGTLGQAGGMLSGETVGFMTLLGMGAMMAGTLQAPLAALLAILELTGDPGVIFPGMLAVIAATLAGSYLHGRESVFLALLRAWGVDYRSDRLARALRHVGVGAAMSRSFGVVPVEVGRESLEQELRESPRWLLVRQADDALVLRYAVDVAHAVREQPGVEEFDLKELPGERMSTAAVDIQASLEEAWQALDETGAEALYVTRTTVPGLPRIYGVLTREDIEAGYRY